MFGGFVLSLAGISSGIGWAYREESSSAGARQTVNSPPPVQYFHDAKGRGKTASHSSFLALADEKERDFGCRRITIIRGKTYAFFTGSLASNYGRR